MIQSQLNVDRNQSFAASHDIAQRITLLPANTTKATIKALDLRKSVNAQDSFRKVFTEQAECPQSNWQALAIRSNPIEMASDHYGSSDILPVSDDRLVSPQAMKAGAMFANVGYFQNDQEKTLPIGEYYQGRQSGQMDHITRVCYDSAKQQSFTIQRLLKREFYRRDIELAEKCNILSDYEEFQSTQLANMLPRQKRIIKLKSKNPQWAESCRSNELKELKNRTDQTTIIDCTRNKFIQITLNASSRRLNTSILRTPAKKHNSTERIISIFTTEHYHSTTAASKRKQGIRLFSRSKQKDGIHISSQGRIHTLSAHKFFRDEDAPSNRKMTCCPSSREVSPNDSANQSLCDPKVERRTCGKKIKPISEICTQQKKPIRLYRNKYCKRVEKIILY